MSEDNWTPEYFDDPDGAYFVHTLSGKPTLDLVDARLKATLNHPNGNEWIPAIWDMRSADLSALTLDSNLHYSQNRPESGVQRAGAVTCAVVATERDFAIVRQFFAFLNLDPSIANIVFDYDEAVAWLKSKQIN